MRPSSAALHQFPGAADAGRDDPGGGVLLEALGVEHASLAAVEGDDGGVGRQAGGLLVLGPSITTKRSARVGNLERYDA
jgi:hypothetical protein